MGIVKDIAFITHSSSCIFGYESSSSDTEFSVPIASFNHRNVLIDSLFTFNSDLEIQFRGNLGVNIFDLFEEENMEHVFTFTGTLIIDGMEQTVEVNVKVYKSFVQYSSGANLGSILLDLTLFFNPEALNPENESLFENPIELIIEGNIIGQ